jgi:hypothetical protein
VRLTPEPCFKRCVGVFDARLHLQLTSFPVLLCPLENVLRIGDTAPNFDAQTSLGKINFYEFLGDSWGVLFSHPRESVGEWDSAGRKEEVWFVLTCARADLGFASLASPRFVLRSRFYVTARTSTRTVDRV